MQACIHVNRSRKQSAILPSWGRGGAIVKEKPAAITAMQRNKRSGARSRQPWIKGKVQVQDLTNHVSMHQTQKRVQGRRHDRTGTEVRNHSAQT